MPARVRLAYTPFIRGGSGAPGEKLIPSSETESDSRAFSPFALILAIGDTEQYDTRSKHFRQNEGDSSMKREIRLVQLAFLCGFSAVLLVSMAASVMAQNGDKTKKFLTKPLVIEDQGSFFIGGVPKVTNYAAVPPAKLRTRPLLPNQITIGQMYVQFQIPARQESANAAGDHGARVVAYGSLSGIDAGRTGRLVAVFRSQRDLHLRRRSGRPRPLGIRSSPSFMKPQR